jgi:LacI family transcriptional regulator
VARPWSWSRRRPEARQEGTAIAKLKDVARRAEVDPSTASRVLRGDPAQQVRPETRQRILEAARELRYRPNALARSLRTRRTGTIGLVIPSLDNVGFADVTHGIQQAAAESGRLVLVVEADALPSDGSGVAEEVYDRLVGDGWVDGLIVAYATLEDAHLGHLADQGIPLVLVNRRTSGISGSVVVDDLAGSRMAVEHLASLGHRRIGFVGLEADTDTAHRRRQGYLDGLALAGLAYDPALEQAAPPTEPGGRDGVTALLALPSGQRPTAVFAASLMSALGVRAGVVAAGLRIPEDVSLIAFNDHPIAEHLAPPLTTVRMPNLTMGREAVHMLLAALDGRPVRDLIVDEAPELVVRASTGRPMAARERGRARAHA